MRFERNLMLFSLNKIQILQLRELLDPYISDIHLELISSV
jgi:hypothetical protein